VTIAAATAFGVRMVAESFFHAQRDARDPRALLWLTQLFRLWSIGHIERNSGWYLVWGCLTHDCVARLPQTRDDLCAQVEPHAMELANAFDFSNVELQAPIAEDDYIAAYHTLLR
jgi:acyl-CoA oxidase